MVARSSMSAGFGVLLMVVSLAEGPGGANRNPRCGGKRNPDSPTFKIPHLRNDFASRHHVYFFATRLAIRTQKANIRQPGPPRNGPDLINGPYGGSPVTVKTDIEIAREAKMKPIAEVAAKLGIPADAIIPYGTTKAKISFDFINALNTRPD